MITIQYNSVDCRVQLSGHAGSGDPGHDLVCSAVSALTYTLEANVKSLEQAGIVRDVEIKLNHGDAVIACKPCADDVSSYVVRRIMAAVCVGYELLADRYPENIRYDVERKYCSVGIENTKNTAYSGIVNRTQRDSPPRK